MGNYSVTLGPPRGSRTSWVTRPKRSSDAAGSQRGQDSPIHPEPRRYPVDPAAAGPIQHGTPPHPPDGPGPPHVGLLTARFTARTRAPKREQRPVKVPNDLHRCRSKGQPVLGVRTDRRGDATRGRVGDMLVAWRQRTAHTSQRFLQSGKGWTTGFKFSLPAGT